MPPQPKIIIFLSILSYLNFEVAFFVSKIIAALIAAFKLPINPVPWSLDHGPGFTGAVSSSGPHMLRRLFDSSIVHYNAIFFF